MYTLKVMCLSYKGSNYFFTMSKLTSSKWFCQFFSALHAIIMHIVSVGYDSVMKQAVTDEKACIKGS